LITWWRGARSRGSPATSAIPMSSSPAPSVLGIDAWPKIPKGTEWKAGVCHALGFGDPTATWRRIISSVKTYADLEPALVGAVERLIDFVTDPT